MSTLSDAPAISVVVPTVDRVALLERCLRGLAAQDGTAYELLVVTGDNPAIHRLLDAWRHRLPLRPLTSANPGAAAKRNLGWRAAQAPLIAFTDDDCEPGPGWLKALTASFDSPAVDLVQGAVAPRPEDGAVGGRFARTIEVTAETLTYPNANLCYRRTALERAGGYDERLTAGEDTDLAWRVRESGGQTRFAPEALVWHAVRTVGFGDHLRSLPRWSTLPAVVRAHPQLRELTHRRVFWKDTHPAAWLALLGLTAATRHPAALALALPHLRRRRHPAVLVSDWAECLVMGAGSIRHRSVLL
jgi:glycosyltransferase involved in cell wall biosynthesis